MENVKAARPVASRQGGKSNRNGTSNSATIIAQHDAACTAMALFTNALAEIAAETEDAQLVKIALYANRATTEWHRLGDVLPTILQLAFAAHGASEAGQP